MPANRKEQAQWTLHRLVPGRGICNIGFTLTFRQAPRWWPLQEALNHLLRRHPALRAVLFPDGTALRKRYLPPHTSLPLETLAGAEEGLDDQLTELMTVPFDMTGDTPLVRAHLIIAPTRAVLAVVLHHAVADATSASVLGHELVELHREIARTGQPPSALTGTSSVFQEPDPDPDAVDYWVEHLSGVDPSAQTLACALPPPRHPTFAGGAVVYEFSPAAVAAVARLRAITRTTDNIVLLAAYYALLARHGGGPRLVVGVPVNARRGTADARTVGYHTNTLPIRVDVDTRRGFTDLVRAVRDAFMTGLENGTVSFESARARLDVRSADWRLPLFRYMFNYVPRDGTELSLDGETVEVSDIYHGMSRVDLELHVNHHPGRLLLDAVYSREAHRHEDVVALLRRYEALVLALPTVARQPIGDLDVRSDADREQEARTNATTVDAATDAIVQDVLEAAVTHPDATAVGDWTYQRLSGAAERVRAALVEQRVPGGAVIGLHAHRGPLLAAAAVGTWLAGAAYLPMDPAHPVHRNAAALEDAAVRLILADGPVPAGCAANRAVIRLDTLLGPGEPIGYPAAPRWAGAAGDLAYVIYTSGSTGRPKGVEVTHRALANVVRHFAAAIDVTATDRMLWLTTYSFDISALELLVPLSVGAAVVVASDEVRRDPAALLKTVVSEDVTVLQGTPTTWRQVAPRLDGQLHGRRVLCGGEPLSAPLASALLADGCRLFNVYGPTETTIWSTWTELFEPDLAGPGGDRIPIGRPIANTGVYVLDEADRPVPAGLPGQLWVTGVGLARGYRGDPTGTARRFVDDPLLGRRYGTGDVVRQRTDGQLEFVGRADRQVKVRGHRVELGEVETILERHPRVALAAVFTDSDPVGNPSLAAMVRPTDAATGDGAALAAELRQYLTDYLPEGALPSRLVVGPLPLTDNGKVDYRAAAAMARQHVPAKERSEPDSPLAQRLAAHWRHVLADPRLDATANFFLSGGHSLLAFELAERISADLRRTVTFEMVFGNPTPNRLAARLARDGG